MAHKSRIGFDRKAALLKKWKWLTFRLRIFWYTSSLTLVTQTLRKVNWKALSLLAISFGLATGATAQQQVYRWVDKDGVVHYGDHVPPEYANRDRDILNDQAVTVGFERGELTAEQRAALEKEQAAEENERRQQEEQLRRDRVLLNTYLTVNDIEALRDRRLELLDSQIRVTEQYLESLRKRHTVLERQAARFTENSDESDANAVMPDDLATELAQSDASISLYEETLQQAQMERQALSESFAADIERFRELTGKNF
jgi:hypothetical protein